MKQLFNSHTHLFTIQFVPDYPVGKRWYIPKLSSVSGSKAVKRLLKIITAILSGRRRSDFDRLITFADIGIQARQEDVWNSLLEPYKDPIWDDIRFVVLPMDMTYMEAGNCGNYFDQLDELVALRLQNEQNMRRILPFLAIDPRRTEFRHGITSLPELAKYYIETNKWCIGIKLYPALGYFPFDERLDPLFQWAAAHGVPVLSHTIQGPIHYQGDKAHCYPPAQYATMYNTRQYDKVDDAQRNFTEPTNFEFVLKKYPDLKLCLAHYGSDEFHKTPGTDIEKENFRWYTAINDMMQKYTNVYTDIAFTLHEDSLMQTIHANINNPALGNKILFGTDFYVAEPTEGENSMITGFRSKMKELDALRAGYVAGTEPSFEKIASDNPFRFLASDFYQP